MFYKFKSGLYRNWYLPYIDNKLPSYIYILVEGAYWLRLNKASSPARLVYFLLLCWCLGSSKVKGQTKAEYIHGSAIRLFYCTINWAEDKEGCRCKSSGSGVSHLTFSCVVLVCKRKNPFHGSDLNSFLYSTNCILTNKEELPHP